MEEAEVEALLAEVLDEFVPLKVLNIYLVGSHSFGVAKPGKSDRDYVCIVRTERDLPGFKYVERGDVNLAIYHYNTFTDFIKENVIWMAMLLFIPKGNVYKETLVPQFQLRKIDLYRVAMLDANHIYAKAKRLFRTDTYTAKKDVIHGIRFLYFAIQLATKRCIFDFQEGNLEWQKIMATDYDNWEAIEKEYLPLYQRLEKELRNLTTCQLVSEPCSSIVQTALRWIETNSFGSLSEELNIHSTCLEDRTILLHADRFYSPVDHPVTKACSNGLLLKKCDGDSYRVIAYPYNKVAKFEYKQTIFGKTVTTTTKQTKQAPKKNSIQQSKETKTIGSGEEKKQREKNFEVEGIPWDRVKVSELKTGDEGRTVTLYFDEGKWRCFVSDGIERIQHTYIENDESGEEGRVSLYSFPSPSYYNPYLFFEETLANKRDGYLSNMKEYLEGMKKKEEKEGKKELSFYDLFWRVWNEKGYQLPNEEEDVHMCFTFEVNLRVLPKVLFGGDGEDEKDEIVLFGVRDMTYLKDLMEIEDFARKYGWDFLQESRNENEKEEGTKGEKEAISLRSVLRKVYSMTHKYGVMLSWEDGLEVSRVRVMSPQYNALKKLFWATTEEQQQELMLEIVKTNDNSRFLFEYPYPEKWRLLWKRVKDRFDGFCIGIEKIMSEAYVSEERGKESEKENEDENERGKGKEKTKLKDRKEFGRIAARYKFKELLFELYATHEECSVREYLSFLPTTELQGRINAFYAHKEK